MEPSPRTSALYPALQQNSFGHGMHRSLTFYTDSMIHRLHLHAYLLTSTSSPKHMPRLVSRSPFYDSSGLASINHCPHRWNSWRTNGPSLLPPPWTTTLQRSVPHLRALPQDPLVARTTCLRLFLFRSSLRRTNTLVFYGIIGRAALSGSGAYSSLSPRFYTLPTSTTFAPSP